MENNTFYNRIQELENKFDRNQIQSMSDKELKCFIIALYKLGFGDGFNDGYDEGWADRSYEAY